MPLNPQQNELASLLQQFSNRAMRVCRAAGGSGFAADAEITVVSRAHSGQVYSQDLRFSQIGDDASEALAQDKAIHDLGRRIQERIAMLGDVQDWTHGKGGVLAFNIKPNQGSLSHAVFNHSLTGIEALTTDDLSAIPEDWFYINPVELLTEPPAIQMQRLARQFRENLKAVTGRDCPVGLKLQVAYNNRSWDEPADFHCDALDDQVLQRVTAIEREGRFPGLNLFGHSFKNDCYWAALSVVKAFNMTWYLQKSHARDLPGAAFEGRFEIAVDDGKLLSFQHAGVSPWFDHKNEVNLEHVLGLQAVQRPTPDNGFLDDPCPAMLGLI